MLEGFLATEGLELVLQGTDKENRIAVVPINGVIASENTKILQEESTVNQLDRILEDQSVRGLVLEIDSPGGTVYESARILKKLREFKRKEKYLLIKTKV